MKDSRLGKMTYSIDDRLKDINGEKLTDSGDDIVEGQQCQKDCEQKWHKLSKLKYSHQFRDQLHLKIWLAAIQLDEVALGHYVGDISKIGTIKYLI